MLSRTVFWASSPPLSRWARPAEPSRSRRADPLAICLQTTPSRPSPPFPAWTGAPRTPPCRGCCGEHPGLRTDSEPLPRRSRNASERPDILLSSNNQQEDEPWPATGACT